MMRGLFISGPATDAGKTFVSRGLTSSLRHAGYPVAALKPIETGCAPAAVDALALAAASRRPESANHPGFYRAHLAAAPYAATLAGEPPVPPTSQLVSAIQDNTGPEDILLVEGAGGLLVPLDASRTVADLAIALQLPLLLVTPDSLGAISSSLTCVESARSRQLEVAALVLVQQQAPTPATAANARILRELAGTPVLTFPRCRDDDAQLGAAAEDCGLLKLVLRDLVP